MSTTTLYRVLALVLIAAAGAHRYVTSRSPAGVSGYHARVKESAASVPRRIGGWVGEDVAVPAQAVSVLDPNVILSRRYRNVENGRSAGLLLVHCADAHDMAGHFPLRCYPAAGWDLLARRPRDWSVGDLRVTGTEYEFAKDDPVGGRARAERIVVANCILRPGGLLLRDNDELARTVVGAGGQMSGAGQLQIYFDAAVPEAERDAAIATLAEGYRPVLDSILATVAQE